MVGMMHGLTINVPINKAATVNVGEVQRFAKLAKLTNQSIRGEVASCDLAADYVQVVAPWITVKCYYRIYYLESILIHLSSGTPKVFTNGGHTYARNTIRTYCKNGYIQSRLQYAEAVVKTEDALAHRITSGMNIRARYYLSEDCVKSVRHKIAQYGVDNWKKNQKYKNYRSNEAKLALASYSSKNEVSLFDYYYLRLKANYRDADFLDFSLITSNDGVEFIKMLKAATDKYCRALEASIVSQLATRNF